MPDNRPSMQINQPDIINVPETNWPDPLVNPASKLKMKVTNGSNGESIKKTLMATVGQDKLSLSEGSSDVKTGNMNEQGGHKDKFKTSQMNSPDPIGNPEPGDQA
jgi:hypothetical protein